MEAKSEVLLEIKRMSFYKTKPDGFFFHREAESKTLLDMWRETLLRNWKVNNNILLGVGLHCLVFARNTVRYVFCQEKQKVRFC